MDEVAARISLMNKQSVEGLLVADEGFFNFHAGEIGELVTRHKLPSCSGEQDGADGGGLMSYGVEYEDLLHRAATSVDKILKGQKPGDIPFEQPSKFRFVINLQTAKALGVTIPSATLLGASRVIEQRSKYREALCEVSPLAFLDRRHKLIHSVIRHQTWGLAEVCWS